MVKTTNFRDTALYGEAQGLRLRNTSSRYFSVALNRLDNTAPDRVMATVIRNETEVLPIFVAPCACRVLRIYANGSPFADMAAGGTVVVTTSKAVIGGTDTALGAGITVGSETVPTLDTAIDDVLTGGATSDLLEGQHVYATVVVSDHDVETAVAYISINVEYVPTEQ